MARYLVTGGAGFLGINLVRYLLDKGCEVTSLDVTEFDYPDCLDRVRIATGDIRDPAAVAEAMKDADIVVHCAAALPLYSKEDIFSTDVDGTRNLLEEAGKQGVERFVMISSTAVYGVPDHHPICEDDKLVGVGPYGEAKIQAEGVCLEYRSKGMCVPIIKAEDVLSALSGWACSPCSMTGQRTDADSLSSAAGTIVTNCWTLKISVSRYGWQRLARGRLLTTRSTSELLSMGR